MRTFYKLALASTAAVLVTGAAQAATPIAIAATGGDIVAGVNVSTTATLSGLSGSLVFTVKPTDLNFATSGTGIDGVVTVTLSNGTILGTPTITGVVDGGGVGTDAACDTATAAATTTAGTSSVTFRVPDIANCGGGAAEGIIEITLSMGVGSLGSSSTNFSVGVARIDGLTLAADTAFDNDGVTAGVQPLINILAPYSVTFTTTGADAAAGRTLQLGLTPPFSAFDTAGTDFVANIGTLALAAGGTATTLQGGGLVGDPEDLDLMITVENATGISKFSAVGFGDLTRVGTTNDFALSVDPAAATISGLVSVTLSGGATPSVPTSVAAQGFTPSATVTEGTGSSAVSFDHAPTSALSGIARAGLTRNFEWVALENAFGSNQFRFTGLDAATDVFVSVTGLNTGEADISDHAIKSSLTVSTGGEANLTGAALGGILQAAGLLDTSTSGVTRGNVSFSIEATGVEVRRMLFSTSGGISTDTALSN